MATETLRPNAIGQYSSLSPYPGTGEENWEEVDEETPDEDSTYVERNAAAYAHDTHNLPAHSGSGTINFIKVYIRCRSNQTPTQTNAHPSIYTYSTKYDGDEKTLTTSWDNYSHQWNQNPNTESAWTWDEIDALQAGLGLRTAKTGEYVWSKCTQVWVEVDYASGIEKSSSDTGTGSEGAPLPTATLADSEYGQGQGAIGSQLAAIISAELGTCVELGALLKELFVSELGQGSDSFVNKIEAPTKGGGMKLWI